MEIGQVVSSKAGRDKGRYFIIIAVDEVHSEYVYIADGDLRKIENLKKKKTKHLIPLTIDEKTKEKLLKGLKITNADLRKSLKCNYQHSQEVNFSI